MTRAIDNLGFEVWYKVKGTSDKARRISAFHFLFDAESYIENQHSSIRDNFFLKKINEYTGNNYPNEIF